MDDEEEEEEEDDDEDEMDFEDEEEMRAREDRYYFNSAGYSLDNRLETARINSLSSGNVRRIGPTLRDLPSRK
jgi:hypothetical protein